MKPLRTPHSAFRILALGALLLAGLGLTLFAAGPSAPPVAMTAFTRGLNATNATAAAFNAALGFLSTNVTSVTNYVGNAASATNLNASELRSGTVPLARLTGITTTEILNGTLDTNDVNAAFYQLLTNSQTGGGVSASEVAAIMATNNAATATVSSGFNGTNLIVQTTNTIVTNAIVTIANGAVSMPLWNYNGVGNSTNFNQRNGMIDWYPSGWDGTNPGFTNTSQSGYTGSVCSIRGVWMWGGPTSVALPTLHLESQGAIRLEPSYGSTGVAGERGYLSLGNEDSATRIYINYNTTSYTNGVANSLGYSAPLLFIAKGTDSGGVVYQTQPGIQGVVAGTNGGIVYGGAEGSYYQGELNFWSRAPLPDRYQAAYGSEIPAFASLVGRMLTNGWKFYGRMLNEQISPNTSDSTNQTINFNLAAAQTFNLTQPTNSLTTNNFLTANLNPYLGTTNMQAVKVLIRSGILDRYLKWPTTWAVASESGTAALPTFVSSNKVIRLELESWGDGDSNVVARFSTGTDSSFAYDTDASKFFTASGVTDLGQKAAVDYLAKALKLKNIWTNMVALYPFVGGSSNTHSWNLKDTNTYRMSWTATGTLTHDANGVTGNGSSGYGNTTLNFTTVFGAASGKTNVHIAVYSRTTAPTDQGRFIGITDATGRMCIGANGASMLYDGPMNGIGPNAGPNLSTNFTGMFISSRAAFDPNEFYLATRLGVNTNSAAASGVPNGNLFVLARNSSGSPGGYSTVNLAFGSVGYGLTSSDCTNLTAIVQTYNTILGRQKP